MEPIEEVAEIAPPIDDEIYVIDEHMIGEIPIVKNQLKRRLQLPKLTSLLMKLKH
jgi:hypothetical protein